MDKSKTDLVTEGDDHFNSEEYAKAVEVYTAALKADRTPYLLIKIGESFLWMNEFSEAAKWLEEGTKESPNDAWACFCYGLALQNLNDNNGAISNYEMNFRV